MSRYTITPEEVEIWKADIAFMQEKERRQYAARRAIHIGYGGVSQVAKILGIDRRAIARGIEEIDSGDLYRSNSRIRNDGGGRNTVADNFERYMINWNEKNGKDYDVSFLKTLEFVMNNYAYGDPSARGIFTKATPEELVEIFRERCGFKASASSYRRSLAELGYSLQKNQKLEQVGPPHPKRNEQFEYRKQLIKDTIDKGIPLLSQDTKAKIKVGLFASNGREWRKIGDPRKALDHDYGRKFIDLYPQGFHNFTDELMNRTAVASPNGVYCLNNNTAFVSVGMDHDTAEFAGNTLLQWYERLGKKQFSNARSLVILCDGGGSNRAAGYSWKLEVAKVVKKLNLDYIQVFHHPPGTSKWDPIEHRLWSMISIHWMGQALDSFETIRGFIESTTTKTGLKVLCDLDYNQYPTASVK